MNRIVVTILLLAVLAAPAAHAANVGFSLGINLNPLPAQVAVYSPQPAYPPQPVYAPAPVYAPQPIVIEQPPEFVVLPQVGCSVAVNLPYDLYRIGGGYYLYRGNAWYRAARYSGPWRTVEHRALPWQLRRYPYAQIRHYREMVVRHDNRDHRPHGGWDGHPGWEGRNGNTYGHDRWQEARRGEQGQQRGGKGRWYGREDD